MRWFKNKSLKLPSIGEVRFITSYCLLPITIGIETRWLKKSYILQVYSDTEELYTDTELDYLLGLTDSLEAQLDFILSKLLKILNKSIQPKFYPEDKKDKLYPCWINQRFVTKEYSLKVKIKKTLI